MRGSGRWAVALLFVGALIWGLAEVVRAPVAAGDVYPPYSSLRSDPLGSKALYESLTLLPELTVERSYKQHATPVDGTTKFILGIDAVAWVRAASQKVLQEYAAQVRSGGRLVIALLPAKTPRDTEKTGALEEEWGLKPVYDEEAEKPAAGIPRSSALHFEAGPEWREEDGALERTFGRGTIVLITESYPLSNQGLVELRDSKWIAWLVGASPRVVFDESQFGVTDSGSVGTLIRKYRLEGALVVLTIAAALFLWRAGSSFPPVAVAAAASSFDGRDAHEGMSALLRRSVPEKDLLKTCVELWSQTGASPAKIARAKDEIERSKTVVDGYRAVHRVLTERK